MQRNGVSKGGNRLHNGQLYQVKEFTQEGDIVLNNGWKVPRDFGYMSHGYVMTSHASQGKTVDHVLISQGMESWGAANREQFYVSASRGKKSVKIYTDNRDELLESVLGTSDRASAHDLLGPLESKQALQDIVHQERERIIGHKEDLVIPPSFEQIELHLPEAENPAIIPSEMPIPKPPLPNVPFANAPFAKGSVAPSPQPWQSKATPKITPSPIGKSEGNEPAPSKEKESEKAPSSIPFTDPLPNIGFPYHSVTFSPVSYQEPKEEKPKSIPEKPIAPPKVQEPPKEDSRFDRVQKLIAKYNGQSIESKPLTEEQRQRRFDAYMKQTGIDVRKSKEQTKQPDKERGE
ncbi:MAG: conjugative transfer relaxase/helicase TraI [Candidatus Sumerlaeia bacterium]|nr:conjugative transfer relaxase/helicase TraI [Candidatus Sumerlaeia bacterium]